MSPTVRFANIKIALANLQSTANGFLFLTAKTAVCHTFDTMDAEMMPSNKTVTFSYSNSHQSYRWQKKILDPTKKMETFGTYLE